MHLTNLGVSRSKLERFILTEERRSKIKEGSLWDSALCRYPLREHADGLQILVPSSIVRALESNLLDCILNTGLGGWMEMFFQIKCAERFVNDVANRLKVERLDFKPPTLPTNMPPLFPFYGMFDTGKPAILLTYCPPLAGALNDIEGHDALSGEEMQALLAHLNACADDLEKSPGFSGGLVVESHEVVRT